MRGQDLERAVREAVAVVTEVAEQCRVDREDQSEAEEIGMDEVQAQALGNLDQEDQNNLEAEVHEAGDRKLGSLARDQSLPEEDHSLGQTGQEDRNRQRGGVEGSPEERRDHRAVDPEEVDQGEMHSRLSLKVSVDPRQDARDPCEMYCISSEGRQRKYRHKFAHSEQVCEFTSEISHH